MRSRMLSALPILLLVLAGVRMPGQDATSSTASDTRPDTVTAWYGPSRYPSWAPCREFLPEKNKPCRVDFNMSQTADGKLPPPVHKDIAVWPGADGKAVVVLLRSSPFAACSLTTTPGPLVRDPSANLSAALTSAVRHSEILHPGRQPYRPFAELHFRVCGGRRCCCGSSATHRA
jgi:hypothetical protein